MWNFKGTLWNSTQNIQPIHWKILFLYNIEILRALSFKSSYAFLKRPPGHCLNQYSSKSVMPYGVPRGQWINDFKGIKDRIEILNEILKIRPWPVNALIPGNAVSFDWFWFKLIQKMVGSFAQLWNKFVKRSVFFFFQNCRDNFGGPQCLACKQGYYMDDFTLRCEICSCPLPSEGNK